MERIDRALRLLRKGAISRAEKALKSKGLGDLSDPEVLQRIKEKFMSRTAEIQQESYVYHPEEELQPNIDKILGTLD